MVASWGGSREGVERKKKTTDKAEKCLRISESLYDHWTELKNLRKLGMMKYSTTFMIYYNIIAFFPRHSQYVFQLLIMLKCTRRSVNEAT